jgi:two-component system sensor histidine kinase YesM
VYLTLIFQHDRQFSLTEQKLHTTQTNILLMLNRIQPHFLFNALNTIRALYAKDLKLGERTLEQFSSYLRQNLEFLTETELISVEKELEHTRTYTDIEKLRFPNIQVQYEIEDTEFEIPPLTVQPLVENAIYHGIKNKRGRGELTVTVEYTDETQNDIRFTVADNGAGFTEERLGQVRNELRTGSQDSEKLSSVYGLYNVNKKLKLYYGEQTEGIKIESEAGKGSRIYFTIPLFIDVPYTGGSNV